MPDYYGGTASIGMKPSFKGFVEDARTQLKRMDLSAEVRIGANIREAQTEVSGFRAEAGRELRIGFDVDTAAADASMARWRAEQQAKPISIGVRADKESRGEKSLKDRLEKLKKAGELNLKVDAVIGAGAAVASLLSVADAMAKIGHTAALLPAIGLGGLAGAGAAWVGFSGLKDTFAAFKEETKDATASVDQHTEALNALSEAQFRVAEAERSIQTTDRDKIRDEGSLRDAYRDTARSIRDKNQELKSEKLSTEDAALSAQDAADKLQKALHDPTASQEDRKRAQIEYQQSLIRLQDQKNKTHDLAEDTDQMNRKGVDGAKAVVDARQKIADDIEAEVRAQHELTQSFAEVAKAQENLRKGGTGEQALQRAMDKLSPNAKELARDVHSIAPAWNDVANAGQDALTNRLGPDVLTLAHNQLPTLKEGIVDIDTAFNTGLHGTLSLLSDDVHRTDFATFLGNTSKGFGGLAIAVPPVVDAVTKLATVGSDFFPAFGRWVDDDAVKFDRFIQTSSADGRLHGWIQEGITDARQLGQSVEHIGSSVSSVLRAAAVGGIGLKGLDDVTGHLASFLKSDAGQDKLTGFFAAARAEGEKFKPLLADIPPLIKDVADATRTWSDVTLPFLTEAGHLLKDHPVLVEAALLTYLRLKTVGPILDGVKTGWKLVGAAMEDNLAKADKTFIGPMTKMDTFKARAGGVVSMLGGPWGIALAAGGAAVTGFVSSVDAGTQAVQRFSDQERELKQTAEGVQAALDATGGKIDHSVLDKETAQLTEWRNQLAANAKDTPGFMDQLTAGVALGFSKISDGVGKGVVANEEFRESIDSNASDVKATLDGLGLTDTQLARILTGSQADYDTFVEKLRGMGSGGVAAADGLDGLRAQLGDQRVQALHAVASGFQEAGDTAETAAGSINDLTRAMDAQFNEQNAVTDAKLKAAQALSNLTQGIGGDNGLPGFLTDGSIDLSSRAGQTLQQNFENLEQGYSAAIAAAKRAAAQAGETADQQRQAAKDAADAYIASAQQQLAAAGIPMPAVKALFQQEQLTSGTFDAIFKADTTQASNAIDTLNSKIDDYRKQGLQIPGLYQIWSSIAAPDDQARHPAITEQPAHPNTLGSLYGLDGHAGGGFLPTSGPGTHVTDGFLGVIRNMPAVRLDGGEGITRAPMAIRYRGELEDINAGRFPKLPGYATGGTIGQQASSIDRASVLENYARSKAGTPYQLGSPDDCSGLMSQEANVAVGLAPNSGRASTANMGEFLSALGFSSGAGGAGSFRVGWINDPNMPGGGHAAGTMPDGTNSESNGTDGVIYGGPTGSNASLFNQHSFLQMATASPAIGGGLAESTANVPGLTTTQVTYPQAPLPARMSDDKIQALTDQAAVDEANAERNKVYNDKTSSPQDKLSADLKYDQAQNALESAMHKTEKTDISLQGFASKAAGILATGVLSFFGLQNSVLSDTNPWNKALNDTVDGLGQHGLLGNVGTLGGYSYQPKNLPQIAVTDTQQTSVPSLGGGAAGTSPGASFTAPPAGGGSIKDIWRGVLAADGWDKGAEWDATDELIGHESSWNNLAQNPDSTAFGAAQFLDETWATVGGAKTSDPRLQAVYYEKYIKQRYGDPESAWSFWQSNNPHWYDDGGVADGLGFLSKNTIAPERTLSAHQTETYDAMLPLLEGLQASMWKTPTLPPLSRVETGGNSGSAHTTHDHSINFYDTHVMDHDALIKGVDQWHGQQQMAALATRW